MCSPPSPHSESEFTFTLRSRAARPSLAKPCADPWAPPVLPDRAGPVPCSRTAAAGNRVRHHLVRNPAYAWTRHGACSNLDFRKSAETARFRFSHRTRRSKAIDSW